MGSVLTAGESRAVLFLDIQITTGLKMYERAAKDCPDMLLC